MLELQICCHKIIIKDNGIEKIQKRQWEWLQKINKKYNGIVILLEKVNKKTKIYMQY